MPHYQYQGRGGKGQLVDGEIEGSSESAVAGLLMDRGVTPISITEKSEKVDVLEQINERLNLHKISIEEQLMFTRAFSNRLKIRY